MARAKIDIEIGKVPIPINNPVRINVHAVFTMKNESSASLSLTVGFPVSHSRYSAFALTSFSIKTNGKPRSVFNRISGYPRQMNYKFISGPDPESYKQLSDYKVAKEPAKLSGIQKIGKGEYQNLMVWGETFEEHQTTLIDVSYTIEIPLQKNIWKKKKVKGNLKGTWPQEANNLPLGFLKSIPGKRNFFHFSYHKYYFFDYYLVSGASWKGTIGEEEINLRFADDSWQGHKLYSNHKDKLVRKDTGKENLRENSLIYTYVLRNSDPTEDLYFALKRP